MTRHGSLHFFCAAQGRPLPLCCLLRASMRRYTAELWPNAFVCLFLFLVFLFSPSVRHHSGSCSGACLMLFYFFFACLLPFLPLLPAVFPSSSPLSVPSPLLTSLLRIRVPNSAASSSLFLVCLFVFHVYFASFTCTANTCKQRTVAK